VEKVVTRFRQTFRYDLLIRRYLCGRPAPFRSVRDLRLVPARCSGESGAPEGCSSPWLPADDSVTPWSLSPSPGLFPATWPRPVLSRAPPPNPIAAGPDGKRVLSRGGVADHEVTPKAPLTGSGCREYSCGGFGGGHSHFLLHAPDLLLGSGPGPFSCTFRPRRRRSERLAPARSDDALNAAIPRKALAAQAGRGLKHRGRPEPLGVGVRGPQPPGKEAFEFGPDLLLRRSVCAAGRPVRSQVSRCMRLSGSDRDFPALTGRSGTQRARLLRFRTTDGSGVAIDRRLHSFLAYGPPSNKQERIRYPPVNTCRPLANVLSVGYLTPRAGPCGAGTGRHGA
jgi:hypothetical protein